MVCLVADEKDIIFTKFSTKDTLRSKKTYKIGEHKHNISCFLFYHKYTTEVIELKEHKGATGVLAEKK